MGRLRRVRLLLLAFVAASLAPGIRGQSIRTVAGGGTDDGRPATEVRLLYPSGVAQAPDGTLWIADYVENRVRRVAGATRSVTTAAGNGFADFSGDGGPAREASLAGPGSLLHRGSDLLVADVDNRRIRRIDLVNSTITTWAGGGSQLGDGGPASQAAIGRPAGLVRDPSGNVHVASYFDARVRRIDAAGTISTFAGTGTAGDSGDGGLATGARLRPTDLAVDTGGSLFILDPAARKVRRVASGTGIITTVAGDGSSTVREGEPATQSGLVSPQSIAVDAAGDLWIGDSLALRRVSAATGRLTTVRALSIPWDLLALPGGAFLVAEQGAWDATVFRFDPSTGSSTVLAGGGTGAIGDGGPAVAAVLARAEDISATADGSILVTESAGRRVRRFRPGGPIQTVAGDGRIDSPFEGVPATSGSLYSPRASVADASGSIYIANGIWVFRVDGHSGLMTRFAGGGSAVPGDGGPARDARLSGATRVALDGRGGLLVSDETGYRIRRVDFASNVISTIAGTGQAGFSGDGGPATAAQVNRPRGLTLDGAGNIYFADVENDRIRRIDASTGRISTFIGGGTSPPVGLGPLPGTSVLLDMPDAVSSDAAGNLLVSWGIYLLRYDASTGLVSQVGGLPSGKRTSGDEGPFADATYSFVGGLARDASGNVFIADGWTRVRSVLACVAVGAPSLASPADGAAGIPTGPKLSWNPAPGAFRYDIYLGATNPPETLVASDLESTSFEPLNLPPATRHYWRVVAKGDPFCVPPSTAGSVVRSFTTAAGCASPSTPMLSMPADGALDLAAPVTLSWDPASGTGTYDLHLGATSPPPVAAAGLTARSFTASELVAGAVYFWSVTSRAACDTSKTAVSSVRSFRVRGNGCPRPAAFSPSAPVDGAAGVPPDVTLSWTASASATSYDVYLGVGSSLAPYISGLTSRTLLLQGLSPGVTYRWRVVARTSCDPGATAETPVRSFTVRGTCATPGATSFAFAPPGNVGTRQTYVLAWSAAADLEGGGGYVVERSTSPSFSPILDAVTTTALFASFVAPSPGSLSHRVRAVPACDPAKAGPWSPTAAVTVVSARPNVVFSRVPEALVVGLGELLEVKRTTFALENVTSAPLQVVVARQELSSVPFFTIHDPAGGDAAFLTLEPKVPKVLELHYSGPPSDVAGSYQGLIVVAATGAGLAITPWAFVSLKVGSSPDAVPQFRFHGVATEYAAFPGVSGSDDGRAPLSVDVHNPGSSPLELAAEVGPEVWLDLEAGWNATPIPPGGTRTLRLSTRRVRAPNGSALPRYTYLTLRTKGGVTSRLLVQDNEAPLLSSGRGASAVRPEASFLVPSVAHVTSALGNTFVSRLSLSNTGTEAVQAEIVFTPASSDSSLVDGFGPAVRRATVVVPPNDVARISDPLVLLFGLTPPVSGTLEVRTAAARAGFFSVASSVDAPSAAGGTFGFAIPVFRSGEGIRAGSSAAVAAVASDAAERTNLILAETTGVDEVRVRVSLHDASGSLRGSESLTVPRWGQRQLSAVVQRLGGAAGSRAGRIEVAVESGGGTLAAVTTVVDNANDDAAAFAARAVEAPVSAAKALKAPSPAWAKATGTVKSLVPALVNGYQTFPASAAPFTFRSVLGFANLASTETLFRLTYYDVASGATIAREVRVPGRGSREYANALEQLFGIGAGVKSQGPLFVESDPQGRLWCRVASSLDEGTIGDSFPVIPVPSEGLTGGKDARLIALDGLEQSVDPSRGTRSNLILNEVAGRSVALRVSLYEAGNRSSPIAERDVTLGPLEKLQLSTVFAELGLESAARSKDRTNVLCTVRALSGDGLASAVVTTIDNRTGDTRNILLAPTSAGTGGTTIGF